MAEEVKTMGQLGANLAAQLTQIAKNPNVFSYHPHEHQIQFHSSEDQLRLFLGGNRSGKTTAGVCEDIFWAMGRNPYRSVPEAPNYIRIIGTDFPNGIDKVALPEIARWVPPSQLKGGAWSTAYHNQKRRLDFENGSFIEFMSADQEMDKFAGTSRHLIHFDEEPPEDIYEENKTRLVDTGGSTIITMTPLMGMTWIFDEIYNKRDEHNITVVAVSMTDNPYLNQNEVANFIQGLSKDARKSRVLGQFVAQGGLIFPEFHPDTHIIEPMLPPTSWEWYCSLDHGLANPTAILWHAVSKDNTIITFSESYESNRLVAEHATSIHSREAMWERTPDYRIIDPATHQRNGVTGTSILQEYGNYGLDFVVGDNAVNIGIEKMKGYLTVKANGKPNWFVTEDCPNFIKEIQRYRYATHSSSKVKARSNVLEVPVKKDDHAMDSARYFASFLPDLRPDAPGASVSTVAHLGGATYGSFDKLLWDSIQNDTTPKPEWTFDYE